VSFLERTIQPGEPGPKFRALTDEEIDAREAALNYAARIAESERPLPDKELQYLYDGFLRENILETKAVIALGLSFGESLTLSMDLEWVRFSDVWGEETGLAPPALTCYCSPINIIQKRLERKEALNIAQLRIDTISTLEESVAEGNIGRR
jgi:hypothetical protein